MDPNRFWRATLKCVGASSVQHFCEVFELVENRLYAYADDSTLPAVVRKPSDRPAVAASLNRDLARIQQWCNHCYIILNPNKIKALVVSRSRTVNSPMVTLSCLGFPFAIPRHSWLEVDNKLTFEDHVCAIVSRVSQRICIFRLVKGVFVDTSVSFRYYYSFFLPIIHVLWCGGLLLNVIFGFSSAWCIRWPGFALIRLSCRCVIDVRLLHFVCCTRLIRTRIILCTVSLYLLLS